MATTARRTALERAGTALERALRSKELAGDALLSVQDIFHTMDRSSREAVAEAKLGVAEAEQAVAKAELGVEKAKLEVAKVDGSPPDAVAKAELAVAEAKQAVAKAELGVEKAKLEVAKVDGSPPDAVAKAELAVAEAKQAVAEAKQAVAEAKQAVAEAKWANASDTDKAQYKALLDTANKAHEQALHVTANFAPAGAAGGAQAASGQGTGGSVDTLFFEKKLDLVMMQLQRLEPKNSPSPSATPPTLGKEQYLTLLAARRWNVVQGDGNPVLSRQQAENVPANCSEFELVQWFTPHLNRLVELASKQVDSPLVLVNSERHGWVEDPSPLGKPSKPDMFVCHPAFWKSIKSPGDKQYDSGNFRFGVCAHWDLRDSVVVIVEWKLIIGPDDYSALGEGVEYSRRIMHTGNNTRVPLDDPMVRITRVILADREKFYLVLCQGGVAIECDWGMWTAAGSEDAIIKFIQNGASPRRWVDAISSLCFEFKVTLVHDHDNPCFLGRGACGRVFRVQTNVGCEYALKVVLDDSRCSMIHEEASKYESNKDQLAKLGCVVTISRNFTSPDRKFAGLLSSPVGVSFRRIKQHIVSAVMGLRSLALSGFQHGDARWPNVVIHEGKAVWLDLRTLRRVGGDDLDIRDSAFFEDLTTFVDSLPGGNVNTGSKALLGHTRNFLDSGDENPALMNELSGLWQ